MLCGQVYGKNAPVFYNVKFYGQLPKMVPKCCLHWIFFHGALYCCVRFSNIEDLRIPYNKNKYIHLETKKLRMNQILSYANLISIGPQ